METCKNGMCDVAARIAAARAGSRASPQAGQARGTGAVIPMEQRDARRFMPSLPATNTQTGVSIGLIALAVLVVIVMGKR